MKLQRYELPKPSEDPICQLISHCPISLPFLLYLPFPVYRCPPYLYINPSSVFVHLLSKGRVTFLGLQILSGLLSKLTSIVGEEMNAIYQME